MGKRLTDQEKADILTRLAKCHTVRAEVLAVIETKRNPFSCKWADTNETRGVNLSEELVSEWNEKKIELAKEYVRLIDRQISLFKKQLGMR